MIFSYHKSNVEHRMTVKTMQIRIIVAISNARKILTFGELLLNCSSQKKEGKEAIVRLVCGGQIADQDN